MEKVDPTLANLMVKSEPQEQNIESSTVTIATAIKTEKIENIKCEPSISLSFSRKSINKPKRKARVINKSECAICLVTIEDYQTNGTKQEAGPKTARPNVCSHVFCLACITEWSKNTNTCPIDRQKFEHIVCLQTGEITHVNVNEDEQTPPQLDFTYCEICGESNREDRMLLCDRCDRGFHCECLNPPLQHIPIEDWYCNSCIQEGEQMQQRQQQSRERRTAINARNALLRAARSNQIGIDDYEDDLNDEDFLNDENEENTSLFSFSGPKRITKSLAAAAKTVPVVAKRRKVMKRKTTRKKKVRKTRKKVKRKFKRVAIKRESIVSSIKRESTVLNARHRAIAVIKRQRDDVKTEPTTSLRATTSSTARIRKVAKRRKKRKTQSRRKTTTRTPARVLVGSASMANRIKHNILRKYATTRALSRTTTHSAQNTSSSLNYFNNDADAMNLNSMIYNIGEMSGRHSPIVNMNSSDEEEEEEKEEEDELEEMSEEEDEKIKIEYDDEDNGENKSALEDAINAVARGKDTKTQMHKLRAKMKREELAKKRELKEAEAKAKEASIQKSASISATSSSGSSSSSSILDGIMSSQSLLFVGSHGVKINNDGAICRKEKTATSATATPNVSANSSPNPKPLPSHNYISSSSIVSSLKDKKNSQLSSSSFSSASASFLMPSPLAVPLPNRCIIKQDKSLPSTRTSLSKLPKNEPEVPETSTKLSSINNHKKKRVTIKEEMVKVKTENQPSASTSSIKSSPPSSSSFSGCSIAELDLMAKAELKPHFRSGKIDKDEYKAIMKKTVYYCLKSKQQNHPKDLQNKIRKMIEQQVTYFQSSKLNANRPMTSKSAS